ncbi:hypothetical protein ACC703_38425, partial [Rhizobium ruizarguesonis]
KAELGVGESFGRAPLVKRLTHQILIIADVQADFSLPYLVSVAVARRGMSVTDFTEAALNDKMVLSVGQKMKLVRDSTLDWKLELPPGRVEITT